MLGQFGIAWRGGILEPADIPDGDDFPEHVGPPTLPFVEEIVRATAGARKRLPIVSCRFS